MLWLLYNILFVIGLIVLLPRFLYRMCRRGGYAHDFMQRFGVYRPHVLGRLREGNWVWIQAVSVGEIFVAFGFMEELRKRDPSVRFVVSTNTSTGHAIGEKNIRDPDLLIYFPLDFVGIVRRVLRIMQPSALVLIECELWPNLIRLARRRGIPVMLVNGRISESSYRGYRKVRLFTKNVLPEVNVLCAQTKGDAERLIALGAREDQLHVMGSAKYDVTKIDRQGEERARDILRAAGIGDDQPIILGGSTWPGEEAALLDIYKALRSERPEVMLVLAPRHVERTADVLKDIEAAGLSVTRRSEMDPGARGAGAADVFLLDTTGELKNFYPHADVIFIGKSLTDHGGQNVIEPAFYGKAIIVGPNMENFPIVIEDFRSADAVVQVKDTEGLKKALADLLDDPARRSEIGRHAAELVERKTGAIPATVDLMAEHLPQPVL